MKNACPLQVGLSGLQSMTGSWGYLNFRDSRTQGAIPVDQAVIPVDEPILVEADEGLLDSCTPGSIHGEDKPVPINAAANAPQLITDAIALCLLPLKYLFKELCPPCRKTRTPLRYDVQATKARRGAPWGGGGSQPFRRSLAAAHRCTRAPSTPQAFQGVCSLLQQQGEGHHGAKSRGVFQHQDAQNGQ